jgi:hypothetical protein
MDRQEILAMAGKTETEEAVVTASFSWLSRRDSLLSYV